MLSTRKRVTRVPLCRALRDFVDVVDDETLRRRRAARARLNPEKRETGIFGEYPRENGENGEKLIFARVASTVSRGYENPPLFFLFI